MEGGQRRDLSHAHSCVEGRGIKERRLRSEQLGFDSAELCSLLHEENKRQLKLGFFSDLVYSYNLRPPVFSTSSSNKDGEATIVGCGGFLPSSQLHSNRLFSVLPCVDPASDCSMD